MTVQETINQYNVTSLVAYSRKSRDNDEQEGLAKHRDILQQYADGLGLPVTIMEEEDSSETLNRPLLNQLREMVIQKKVQALIVYRLDRLTRKTTDTERLLEEWKFHGLILIEVNRDRVVDYSEVLALKLEAVMNDLYLEGAKMVLNAGRKKAVQLYGNHLGKAPYGYNYDRDSKKLIPNEQAPTVLRMFQMIADGYSRAQVSDWLRLAGIPTPEGGQWRDASIHAIIYNIKYIGTQVYGKTKSYKNAEGKKVKKANDGKVLVYEGAHEAIVPKELFDRVQSMRHGGRKAPPSGSARKTHVLSSLMRCGNCGALLTITTVKGRTYLHACSTRDDETNWVRCRNSNSGRMPEIETFAKNCIQGEVNAAFAVVNAHNSQTQPRKATDKTGDELKTLQKERTAAARALNRLIDVQIEAGVVPLLVTRIKSLQGQIDGIDGKMEELKNSRAAGTDGTVSWMSTYMELHEPLMSFVISYRGADDAGKNRMLRKYIKYILVTAGQPLQVIYTDEVKRVMLQAARIQNRVV